jgi:DNA modification methylase
MPATIHRLIHGDARNLAFLDDESVHLVVTSPPYWNLKRYNEHPDQLGHVQDYETFIGELEKVWRQVFRILVPGGRLVCVVGDVCVARRALRNPAGKKEIGIGRGTRQEGLRRRRTGDLPRPQTARRLRRSSAA